MLVRKIGLGALVALIVLGCSTALLTFAVRMRQEPRPVASRTAHPTLTSAKQPQVSAVAVLDQFYVGDPATDAPLPELQDEANNSVPQTNAPGASPQSPPPTPQPVLMTYTVRRGDTLAAIAYRFGVALPALVQMNGLRNMNQLEVGQVLRIKYINAAPVRPPTTYNGPSDQVVPDSEVVYGPAYKGFSVQAIARRYNGYLLNYREMVEGRVLTGPQIIQLVAERYSVGPRVLLTLLELHGGWVTQPNPTAAQIAYPMGFADGIHIGLFNQTAWAAVRLNAAYYLSVQKELSTLTTFDGDRVNLPAGLNPGSIAVQNVIARSGTWARFSSEITQGAFRATYIDLFDDPFQFEVKNLIPANLAQPFFRLPWSDNQTWAFTGGPHNGWDAGSAWAAVDFAPPSSRGSCAVSAEWALAVAPGTIVAVENGRVVENLSGDAFQGSGWSILYMHQSSIGRVAIGTKVQAGDRIGHPSCEGGISTGTHMHLARLYNGQWIAADDARIPLQVGGWTIQTGGAQYDGYAVNGNEHREACACGNPSLNGITARPGLLVEASASDRPDRSGVSTTAIQPASDVQPPIAGNPSSARRGGGDDTAPPAAANSSITKPATNANSNTTNTNAGSTK